MVFFHGVSFPQLFGWLWLVASHFCFKNHCSKTMVVSYDYKGLSPVTVKKGLNMVLDRMCQQQFTFGVWDSPFTLQSVILGLYPASLAPGTKHISSACGSMSVMPAAQHTSQRSTQTPPLLSSMSSEDARQPHCHCSPKYVPDCSLLQ